MVLGNAAQRLINDDRRWGHHRLDALAAIAALGSDARLEVGAGALVHFAHWLGHRLASPEAGRRILTRLQTLSAPFGTTITIDGATGVIRPATSRGAE